MRAVMSVFSLIILSGVTATFISIYVESQYGIHNILAESGWWTDIVVPVLAIMITILIFIWQQENDKRIRAGEESKILVQSCNALLAELADHNTALNTEKHSQTIRQDKKIHFTNAFLNTEAYTSVSKAGTLTIFESHTQTQLSNLYIRIFYFNMESRYRFQLRDSYEFGLKTTASKEYYEKRLASIERYLTLLQENVKDSLPLVIELIMSERHKTRHY